MSIRRQLLLYGVPVALTGIKYTVALMHRINENRDRKSSSHLGRFKSGFKHSGFASLIVAVYKKVPLSSWGDSCM